MAVPMQGTIVKVLVAVGNVQFRCEIAPEGIGRPFHLREDIAGFEHRDRLGRHG